MTAPEVVEMLAYLEQQIQNLTALPEAEQQKSIKRLEAAKVEVQESKPDKESIAKSLKRVNETLNEAGETTEEVKKLTKELFPTVLTLPRMNRGGFFVLRPKLLRQVCINFSRAFISRSVQFDLSTFRPFDLSTFRPFDLSTSSRHRKLKASQAQGIASSRHRKLKASQAH